ncbi:signal peptide peptidase SppA [Sphingobacterium psychroaquaticum]|uniref:Protease-4 n=1 Tax=Sphingobacterium psychroaquaticum TaxID=561061 RepID=A0A1X7I066_9SPHI|nr:signal peptide peptidase SppA [Sphingobacterium psychroaquaticum]QBQ42179.1 signal peptide peptidase SppA [Sphingobacterium psychroaquaticum]SMG07139.1 protease-4 [Sphingobacterium psychroaquaticum]
MKSFLKYVLATITGIAVVFVLLFFILVAVISSTVSQMGSSTEANVPNNAVLYVSLNHVISERTAASPWEGIDLPGYGAVKSLGLNDIVARIQAAKEDSRIKGIYFNPSSVNAGMATVKAIREALVDFKKSGKFIIAYSDVYTQKGYYLASVADSIYMNPEGSLDFKGLSSSVTFLKEALDKLGVDMQVVKVGTYKSAVEPFLLNEMSAANREQMTSYLNSTYDAFLANIAEGRKIPADSLRAIADNYLIRNADDAKRYKFIDDKLYKDELLTLMKKRLGVEEKKDIPTISLLDYSTPAKTESATDRVAVLYAYGDIVDGEGSEGSIGGEKLSRELRKLRRDDRVKAVVLRVNSPGGSALASDIIAREVELTKKVKPVVVSMGDYAASGGYYISALADSIFAEKETLTGSIGVFGLIPNMKGLLNNKLGIHMDEVKTGKFADLMTSVDRPLTAEEYTIVQAEVNRVYHTFTSKVSTGRKMTVAAVDSIGQGRVWTGQQAVANGLVDGIGGLQRAINSAAAKAKLKTYRTVEYPAVKDPFASILSTSKEKIKMWVIGEELGEYRAYIEQLRTVTKRSGIQARVPYSLEIK